MKSARQLAAALAAFTLSACFGGGGSSGEQPLSASPSPASPAPTAPSPAQPAPQTPTNSPKPAKPKPAPFDPSTTDAPTPPDLSFIDPVAPLDTAPNRDVFLFSQQATLGSNSVDLARIETMGLDNWIRWQISLPWVSYADRMQEHIAATGKTGGSRALEGMFWERAIHGQDQLRQRIAHALSQIVVVSTKATTAAGYANSMTVYADILQEQALGNYCDLIRDVSLTPAMGRYLTHIGNRKADPERGFEPDENYARELMQLFTIGLEELAIDGTELGRETYSPSDVSGLAAVFTGLSYAGTEFDRPKRTEENIYQMMEGFPSYHEEQPKAFLRTTIDVGSDPFASIDAALDVLLAHPNVAPFVGKQLIQKLVTSNPSPAYVRRVAEAFNAGKFTLSSGKTVGTRRRCDLAATAAAILLDPEARQGAGAERQKLREPMHRFIQLMRAVRPSGSVSQDGAAPEMPWKFRRLEDANRLGQEAFASPSVFNFYRPGYVAPGTESGAAGLLTPEFQLTTAPSLVGYINMVKKAVRSPRAEPEGAELGQLDLRQYYELGSESPEQLVRAVSYLLIGERLEPYQEQQAIEAVSLIGSDRLNNFRRDKRVETAFVMVMTSPDYLIQN